MEGVGADAAEPASSLALRVRRIHSEVHETGGKECESAQVTLAGGRYHGTHHRLYDD